MSKKTRTPLPLIILPKIFPVLERFSPAMAERLFVYLFFTPLRYKTPAKEMEAIDRAEKFILTVEGKKIQCYTWGKGRPVLMIHGWAGRATQFRKFIAPLNKAGYQAVAFDGPAHGKSEGKKTNPQEFVSVIRAVSEKVGGLSAIVAHSFGGVASLQAIVEGVSIPIQVNIASPTIGDKIIGTYLKAVGATWITGNRFKRYVVKKSGQDFEKFTSLSLIEQVNQPLHLLLVHDEDDKDVTLDHAEALVKKFPGATLHRTRGLGHTRILKDDEVIRHIVTYIHLHTS